MTTRGMKEVASFTLFLLVSQAYGYLNLPTYTKFTQKSISSFPQSVGSFFPSLRFAPRQRCARNACSIASMSMDGNDGVSGVAVILLAGGVGSRMKADRPKQFLELEGKPILFHSLDLFMKLKGIISITVVIAEEYRDMFADLKTREPRLRFASPGKERQDSVYNGFQTIPNEASLVCIHDAARPLVTAEEIYAVLKDGAEFGAAVLGVPCKATIKESEDGKFVLRTIERSRLWEVHTPQVIRPALLRQGFDKVKKEGLAVTDDVSIIEQLPAPVRMTLGEYTNIKITTPEDMPMALSILNARRRAPAAA